MTWIVCVLSAYVKRKVNLWLNRQSLEDYREKILQWCPSQHKWMKMWTANAAKAGQCLPVCTELNKKAMEIGHQSLRGWAGGQYWCSAWHLDLQMQKWSSSFCWSTDLSIQVSFLLPAGTQAISCFVLSICEMGWHHTCASFNLFSNPSFNILWCDNCEQVKRLPMHWHGVSSSLLQQLTSLWRLAFSTDT